MNRAQALVDSRLCSRIASHGLTAVSLDLSDTNLLRLALEADASDYLYSGLISLGDAIRSVESGLYTWATVKLYYSVFYICRSMLATQHCALLYLRGSQCSLKCNIGSSPAKLVGTTHKALLSLFAREFPANPLLSQQIDSQPPFLWLMERRESANYKQARFIEPGVPDHFLQLHQIGLRKAVATYLSDSYMLYAFDPDHAALAFPLLTLQQALQLRASKPNAAVKIGNASATSFLRQILADKSGPISDLVALVC